MFLSVRCPHWPQTIPERSIRRLGSEFLGKRNQPSTGDNMVTSFNNLLSLSRSLCVVKGQQDDPSMSSLCQLSQELGANLLESMDCQTLYKLIELSGKYIKRGVGGAIFSGKRMKMDGFKRRGIGSEFLGKRGVGSEFLGKRALGSEFLGKRRILGSEFLGKRSQAQDVSSPIDNGDSK